MQCCTYSVDSSIIVAIKRQLNHFGESYEEIIFSQIIQLNAVMTHDRDSIAVNFIVIFSDARYMVQTNLLVFKMLKQLLLMYETRIYFL